MRGSSCQENSWGSFHPREPRSLEGRSLLGLPPPFLLPIAMSRWFSACKLHHLGGLHKCPIPALSLHFIHSPSAKVWIREKLNQHRQFRRKARPYTAPEVPADINTAGQLPPVSSHPTHPWFPPIVSSLDIEGIRSTAGLFLCSRGLGSEENIRDISRKSPWY